MIEHLSPFRTSGPQFSPVTPSSVGLDHHGDGDSRQSQSTKGDTTQEMAVQSLPRQVFGVKLCGDNVDWTVTPRSIRADRQTQSIHYFHSYAVRDRIDMSGLSDIQPTSKPSMSEVISKILPTAHEESLIHDEFVILLAHMLCSNMKYFKWTFAGCIDWHIKHRHSPEMSRKSEVVS